MSSKEESAMEYSSNCKQSRQYSKKPTLQDLKKIEGHDYVYSRESIGSPIPTYQPNQDDFNQIVFKNKCSSDFPNIQIETCEEKQALDNCLTHTDSMNTDTEINQNETIYPFFNDDCLTDQTGERRSSDGNLPALLSPTATPVFRRCGSKEYIVYDNSNFPASYSEGDLNIAPKND